MLSIDRSKKNPSTCFFGIKLLNGIRGFVFVFQFQFASREKVGSKQSISEFLSIEKGPAMARSIENTKASLCSLGSGNDQTERTVVTSPRQIVNGFLTASKNCALPFWQSIISSRKVPGKTSKRKKKRRC